MSKISTYLFAFTLSICTFFLNAQEQKNAAQIKHDLEGLKVLGSVLYVAAHPDDENTRLISYFNNKDHYYTTYVALTRGDGGQNLIGTELRELLGLLRTQELLAARSIDGGNQVFTRANDFGYSKHPNETLRIWDSTAVMSDLIRAIRTFKPDIIVNRFDHRTPGRTHGHHTSSAILSYDAFDLSNDTDVFPDQLVKLEPWQAKREFFNTSWWFYGSRENFEKADKSQMVNVDIGTYFPLLGESNSEIAAASRSMHKCQGFGNAGTRGEQLEYIELVKGDDIKNNDPFYGINTTWSRVKGGEAIGAMVDQAIELYDLDNPSAIVPQLLTIKKEIEKLDDEFWRDIKSKEIKDLIQQCLGLHLSAHSDKENYAEGDSVNVSFEMVNRSDIDVRIKRIEMPWKSHVSFDNELPANRRISKSAKFAVKDNWRSTNPYWLNEKGKLGLYHVDQPELIGLAETPTPFTVKYHLSIDGEDMIIDGKIQYAFTDPVKAQIKSPLYVMPNLVFTDLTKSLLVSGDQHKTISMKVKSFGEKAEATVALELPQGWASEPSKIHLSLDGIGSEQLVEFTLHNTSGTSKNLAQVIVTDQMGVKYSRELIEIDYDHIPKQKVLLPAEIQLVKLDIESPVKRVGYIAGAGDKIPESLRKLGIQVDELSEDDVLSGDLGQYEAIVMGIRVLNVEERISYLIKSLNEYVYQGGNLIWQYNTSHRLKASEFTPFPLKLSRDRVSDEYAEMTILEPNHAFFNTPNKIEVSDFDNWVQERGLYFPSEWGDEFVPLLSCHDKGETAKLGSLLIAPYGKGNVVYTGLSWFRELPEAVPGAYKMFVNLLALPQNPN